MNGIGTVTLANGKQYTGEWKEGKRIRWVKDKEKDLDNGSVISNFTNKFAMQGERDEDILA